MTTKGHSGPGFSARRSSPQRRWSSAPIIDAQAVVVARRPAQPSGFPSSSATSRSTNSGAAADRPARRRARTLLWTAPAGLAIAGTLFALALFAAPDRPVAEPLVRAALLADGGAR